MKLCVMPSKNGVFSWLIWLKLRAMFSINFFLYQLVILFIFTLKKPKINLINTEKLATFFEIMPFAY